MKTNDRRNIKTIRSIKEELFRELYIKKYSELTVSGICDSLNISRRTFYLHFPDIEGLFRDIIDDINLSLNKGFKELIDKDIDYLAKSDEVFRLVNETILHNIDYFTRIATDPSYEIILLKHTDILKEMIRQVMMHSQIRPDILPIYLEYYISGILSIYMKWFHHDTDFSMEDIRSFALGMLESNMKYFLPEYHRER